MKLEIGDKAPFFKLKNQDDVEIALTDLISKKVILYFYPKDNTPGCTIEALDFTEMIDEFEKKGAVVVGISPDSTKSHKKFIQNKELKHILLSDTDKAVATSYGAYGKKMMYGKEVFGIIRSSFIIGQDGRIEKIFYNIKAKGHAKDVLDSL
ncbi:thioredoxin-dependent thiol peroxidase [Helicobacter cappadocius]|uniref:Putative peroxiredoxin bcp n=1 Tax=Helicobacter cappadocius TaxID=3063998 RepID=A0AA90PUA1_9HELI|nr:MULTISPECIES: thioredoxin-dependent thiol peroxidase [unclassified Helicobacter]MDO7252812.1 thioredoxin-dependent thiol peroxidase [Helicobacter sp. faydin-H75]MDP2538855.1 thioredoxin-dependent thiol peroxidase [Helicobacter sp. faydin-H76]